MPPAPDDRKTSQVTFKLDDDGIIAALERMAQERSRQEGKQGRDVYSRNTLARQLVLDGVARWQAAGSGGATATSPPASAGADGSGEAVLAAIDEASVKLLAGLTHVGERTAEAVKLDILQLRRDIATVLMNLLIHSGHSKEKAADIAYSALKPKTS